MNTTELMQVEIDERIREQPDLLRAVTETTHYLQEQVVDDGPPAKVTWRYADKEGKLLQLTLSDTTDPATHTIQRNFWVRWILDTVNQKLCVLRAWSELLSKRSDTRMARITQLISKLKEELNNGQEDLD